MNVRHMALHLAMLAALLAPAATAGASTIKANSVLTDQNGARVGAIAFEFDPDAPVITSLPFPNSAIGAGVPLFLIGDISVTLDPEALGPGFEPLIGRDVSFTGDDQSAGLFGSPEEGRALTRFRNSIQVFSAERQDPLVIESLGISTIAFTRMLDPNTVISVDFNTFDFFFEFATLSNGRFVQLTSFRGFTGPFPETAPDFVPPTPVPVPPGLALFASALGLAGLLRRGARRRADAPVLSPSRSTTCNQGPRGPVTKESIA